MKAFLQKVAKFASTPDRRRYFERRRLAALPRYLAGVSRMRAQRVHFVDAASLLSASTEIFDRGIYRFSTANPTPRIIDGGANIGLAVLDFKTQHPGARILSFEADPRIAAVLRKNISEWGFDGVEVIERALAAAEGKVVFFPDGADSGRLGVASEGALSIEVQAVRLSSYLEQPIDFLKLDIEGAETAVLEEAQSRLGAVERLFVEYHSFANQPQSLSRLLTLLQDSGFRLHLHPVLTSPRPFEQVTAFLGMDLQMNIFGWRER